MSSKLDCQQITSLISDLQQKKTNFDAQIDSGSRNTDQLLNLQEQIEAIITEIIDSNWPYENLAKEIVGKNYDFQTEVLRKRGVLERLNEFEGIRAIDGNFYPMPTEEQVVKKFKEKVEKIKLKIDQGFKLPILVPFGVKLSVFVDRVGDTIIDHYTQGKLFAAKRNNNDPDKPLDLDLMKPINIFKENFDEKAIYDPEAFVYNPAGDKGKNKQAKLEESDFPGWQLLLVEDMPNLPTGNSVEKVGGRIRLDCKGRAIKKYIAKGETKPSINEFYKAVKTEQMYQGERGMTFESWLAYLLYHLEAKDEVIDTNNENGRVSYLLGAFSEGYIPFAWWSSSGKKAALSGELPPHRDFVCAPRMSVEIS